MQLTKPKLAWLALLEWSNKQLSHPGSTPAVHTKSTKVMELVKGLIGAVLVPHKLVHFNVIYKE